MKGNMTPSEVTGMESKKTSKGIGPSSSALTKLKSREKSSFDLKKLERERIMKQLQEASWTFKEKEQLKQRMDYLMYLQKLSKKIRGGGASQLTKSGEDEN